MSKSKIYIIATIACIMIFFAIDAQVKNEEPAPIIVSPNAQQLISELSQINLFIVTNSPVNFFDYEFKLRDMVVRVNEVLTNDDGTLLISTMNGLKAHSIAGTIWQKHVCNIMDLSIGDRWLGGGTNETDIQFYLSEHLVNEGGLGSKILLHEDVINDSIKFNLKGIKIPRKQWKQVVMRDILLKDKTIDEKELSLEKKEMLDSKAYVIDIQDLMNVLWTYAMEKEAELNK